MMAGRLLLLLCLFVALFSASACTYTHMAHVTGAMGGPTGSYPEGYGNLAGNLLDTNDATVSSAVVYVQLPNRRIYAEVDAAGHFIFPLIPCGKWPFVAQICCKTKKGWHYTDKLTWTECIVSKMTPAIFVSVECDACRKTPKPQA